jgi:integrase
MAPATIASDSSSDVRVRSPLATTSSWPEESPSQSLSQRATRTWRAAGLEPIGLHECRHTFASLMIAAGVNAKALSTFLGHASVTITLDRYGHLFPGSEKEAAGLLDSYLERSVGGGPA